MSTRAKTLSKSYLLQTRNTQMAFAENGDHWVLLSYGERAGSAEELRLLTQQRTGSDSFGHPARDTYPAFGADRGRSGMEKFGAIQATHADGNVSVQWKTEKASVVPDAKGTVHLVFDLVDRSHAFRARQHFRAIVDCDVIETWVELRNGEAKAVRLSRMASFGMESPALADEFHLLSVSGQWACEANLTETEIQRGQTLSLGARSGVRGAWENNPAFMLSIGPRADEEHGRVLAGALAWSGAWEISAQHAFTHELRLFLGAANPSGPYVLDPGRTITLPKAILTFSAQGKGPASRALHRWAREWRLPHGKTLRDILLNSWEGAYMKINEPVLTGMMDGVKELGGELFVIDDGWFGRGEFARDDDHRGLGDWCWNTAKLPKGPAYLVKEAKARGLKLGLWFEPEMANTASEIATKHPDWIIRENGRELRQGRGGTQVVLDLTNPAVRDNVFRQVDAIIRASKGLLYIKWDANADFMNAGSAYLDADHQANLWFDYTVGVYELFARLRKAHPEIVFQACSSGGAHADYGWLEYADGFWGSDNTCSQQRVFIQWGEEQFYPAASVAAHVTAVPNHQTGRDAPLKYRFDVAMSGRLGFELQPKDLSADEIAFCKAAVANYKRLRPIIQQGDLYRLVSPYDQPYAAMLFVSPDRRHAVAMVYGQALIGNQGVTGPLPIRGLDPSLRYKVEEINRDDFAHVPPIDGKTFSGASLLATGITFALRPEDDSIVLEFTAR